MSEKKSGWGKVGLIVALVFGVVVALSLPCIGVVAAIAIPAFVKYIKQTKTSEAGLNLKMMGDGVVAYYQDKGKLPPSAGPTPNMVPKGTQVSVDADAWDAEGWKAIRFMVHKPVYYQYAMVNDGDTSMLSAKGDLDGDGVTSEFLVKIHVEDGEATVTPVYLKDIDRELE
ncbi:MAG: hypothetical protein AAFX99_25880 [Myxococcota bacterium]